MRNEVGVEDEDLRMPHTPQTAAVSSTPENRIAPPVPRHARHAFRQLRASKANVGSSAKGVLTFLARSKV